MSHGIQEYDKGVVNGTTWHGLPQYVTQATPVTIDQALEVLDFPIVKDRNYRLADEAEGLVAHELDSYHLFRPDINEILVHSVGEQFEASSNAAMVNFVNENLMAQYPSLEFESVGTLFNGATAFVNIKVAEHHVKGDDSPTVDRLMYYNPLGKGSHQCCAHSIRIVCNNTLQIAAAQGRANETLRKFRHTASAATRINAHLVDLSAFYLELESYHDSLNMMAETGMNMKQVDQFLEKMFPTNDESSDRAVTIAENKREAVKKVFDAGQEGLIGDTRTSSYAMLNAVTNVLDHQKPQKGQDDMSVRWDGIVGNRAKTKDRAFVLLNNI